MTMFRDAIKQRIKALVMLFPWGMDIYRRYWEYDRYFPCFRDAYQSLEAAMASIGSESQIDYEYFNSTRDFDAEMAKFDKVFDDSDYPVVFWLSRLMESHQKVMELGGNVGWAYYSYQRFFAYPQDLTWTISETPSAVANGREIARLRGNEQLRFIESIGKESEAGIFLTSGTLQYLSDPVADIMSGMKRLPEHVIVNRTPMYDGPEYWTVQNLGINEVPYKIQNRQALIDSLRRLGYEIQDSWRKARAIEIPFHPECDVDCFHGIYFRLP
jgi:putative methyltransferase (TIGR04325 family)